MENCPYRDKIEELDDKTSKNEYRIEMLENGDWYSNKELLEKYEKHEERLSHIEKDVNLQIARYLSAAG